MTIEGISLKGSAQRIYGVGTLTYTKAALAMLFFWLLAGDFVYIIIQQIEPRILPVLLKQHGASDQQIAIIAGSIPAFMNFCINPVVSYRSDRTRSKWGRRIPYLVVATPFVSVFLAAIPFGTGLARHAVNLSWLGGLFALSPWAPVMLMFALLVIFYESAQMVITPIYIYLFRDVVPIEFMGRFLALMRVFSALGTFAINYWLVGLVETHAKAIFLALAALNLVCFILVCCFVREGEYPPVSDVVHVDEGTAHSSLYRASLNFIRESFTSRVYWWTYIARLLIYSSIPMSGFLIFFAQREVGLGFDQAGKFLAWPSLAWVVVAYPIGLLMDKWRAVRALTVALWISAVAYTLSFFFVVGAKTFFVSSMLTGVTYWMIMLGQILLAQEVFSRERMGQLCAANTMIQSLVIACITGPLTGWLLSMLQNVHYSWQLPFVGAVELGPYRFVNLLLAGVLFLSLFAIYRLRRALVGYLPARSQ